MAEAVPLPIIKPGERASIAGRTGSGKSTLANWLAWRSPGKWVILNPKGTAAYEKLPYLVSVDGLDLEAIIEAIEDDDIRFINVKPDRFESSPQELDDFIGWLHDSYRSIGLLVDELYTIHENGRPGPGFVAWLTRGRELKQSYIGLTQRPKWISLFSFSEADYMGEFDLQLKGDRLRMEENSGREEMTQRLPVYYWRWYEVIADRLTTFAPVPFK